MYPLFSKDDVRNGSDWLKRHIIVKVTNEFHFTLQLLLHLI